MSDKMFVKFGVNEDTAHLAAHSVKNVFEYIVFDISTKRRQHSFRRRLMLQYSSLYLSLIVGANHRVIVTQIISELTLVVSLTVCYQEGFHTDCTEFISTYMNYTSLGSARIGRRRT